MNKNQIITLLHFSYWIGIIADAISTIILLLPDISKSIFGLATTVTNEYLYVSRIGASLMLGWTFLLFWADRKPVERRDILLLTIFPVVMGIFLSGILNVTSNFISLERMIPLFVLNIFLIILYLFSYWKSKELT